MNQNPFTHLLRVRYSEVDPQNVVFNARYAEYFDIAVSEYFRAVLGGYDVLFDFETDMQVVNLTINWKASAKFDDVLAFEVETKAIGTTSVTFAVRILNYHTGQLLVDGTTTNVTVDLKQHKKIPVHPQLRDKFATGAAGVLNNHAGVEIDNPDITEGI